MRGFLAERFSPDFREAMLIAATFVQSLYNCPSGSSSFRELVESSRPTIGWHNELANVHRHHSALHLRPPNDHVEVCTKYNSPSTCFHVQRALHRAHPRYASASTFVIGSPSSFSFSVSRVLFAHIGYTGNCRACLLPFGWLPSLLQRAVGFLSVTYLYPRDTTWVPLALSRSLAVRLINPGLSLNPVRKPRTGVRSINDFWYKLSAVLRPQTTVHYIVGAVGVHGLD